MGWNSWDSFGPTIAEAAARANADILARRLLPHGWRIFTIDIQWYEPGADSFEYRKGAQLEMDQWGRLMPAPNRFPSAAGGAGFKVLADHAHGLGLQFGIHILRGIPRQAVEHNLPVLGSGARARDIADTSSVCAWNTDMYGVDMKKPGAQDYYDSLARLYASWGVNFIKADDMSRPYDEHAPEIHALHRALEKCGRPIALSLSPGETPLVAAGDVAENANMWRISDDFWDSWPALLEQFERLKNWATLRRPGTWPDADMLPLGTLELGKRKTNFTAAEQRTLMSLWCIARSPLIMGGDLRSLDDNTAALLTNDEVLAVNQASDGNRELYRTEAAAAWTARAADGGTYLALFNLADREQAVPVAPRDVGFASGARIRDLWEKRDLPRVSDGFAPLLPAHGAGLYRLG